MNRKLIFSLFIFLLALIIGCISLLKYKNDKLLEEVTLLKEQNLELLDKIKYYQDENSILNKKITVLENEINAVHSLVEEQILIINSKNNKDFMEKYIVLPIYSVDIYTFDKEVISNIIIPKESSLKEKLDVIAGKLSRYCFSNLPIEVVKIEEIDNKQIAIVNLKEASTNEEITEPSKVIGTTWKYNYFQGSCGGTCTFTKLVETFLQRDYNSEWIDGVQFLYYNEAGDFEHVEGLFDINYR